MTDAASRRVLAAIVLMMLAYCVATATWQVEPRVEIIEVYPG